MITRQNFFRISAVILFGGATYFAYFKNDVIIAVTFLIMSAALFLFSFLKKREVSNLTITNFINVFTHFRVTLDSDANVFQALSALLSITNGALYSAIETLIAALATDHSVTPFITFAKAFKHRFVTHIMINVYMLINHGLSPKHLWQFNYMFETLVAEYNETMISAHESSYERFEIILFMGSGVMIFTLMASVLSMIGGL